MKDLFTPNDGSRPSQLELGRRHTGEQPSQGSDAERAFDQQVDASTQDLAPFDPAILRAAAHRVDDRPPERAAAAPKRPWWMSFWLVPALAACLALVVVLVPGKPTNRVKGDVDLEFMVLRQGEIQPGIEGATFQPGERIQFSYRAPGLESLVLLSVDGAGVLSQYYPAAGEVPYPITPGERHVLEGSWILDSAPGPEVFVAVFGAADVDEARTLVLDAYESGGHDALEALSGSDPAIDTIRIEKQP